MLILVELKFNFFLDYCSKCGAPIKIDKDSNMKE